MLKACWDCLAGDQQRQGEDRYSKHIGSNAPPWPVSNAHSGRMFAVPTLLRQNDEVIIKGIMTEGMFDISLQQDSNDQSNIVAQLNVVYPYNPDSQPHDQMLLRSVVNGSENLIGQYAASEYFTDTNFDVRLIIMPSAVRISIGETYLESVPLYNGPDDIRYISVRGQVKELNFRFKAY